MCGAGPGRWAGVWGVMSMNGIGRGLGVKQLGGRRHNRLIRGSGGARLARAGRRQGAGAPRAKTVGRGGRRALACARPPARPAVQTLETTTLCKRSLRNARRADGRRLAAGRHAPCCARRRLRAPAGAALTSSHGRGDAAPRVAPTDGGRGAPRNGWGPKAAVLTPQSERAWGDGRRRRGRRAPRRPPCAGGGRPGARRRAVSAHAPRARGAAAQKTLGAEFQGRRLQRSACTGRAAAGAGR